MKTSLLSFVLFCLSALTAHAASATLDLTPTTGTLTSAVLTTGPMLDRFGVGVELIAVTWVSFDAGNFVVTLPTLDGTIECIVTDPGATAPSDNYDITLIANGFDWLCGKGTNRDTADTEAFVPLVGDGTGAYGLTSPTTAVKVRVLGAPVLTIAAAGDAKGGIFYLYLDRR